MWKVVLVSWMLSAGSEKDSAESVIERMRLAQRNLGSMTAALTQVKSYPQLGIEDPAERGRLFLKRNEKGGTRLRIDIREPEARSLAVRDGKYLLYQPRIKQAIEGELGSDSRAGLFSSLLAGHSGSSEELERDYRVEHLGPDNLEDREVVKLRFDARPGARVHCQRVELWIDSELWLPRQQSCVEGNGNVILLTLDELELEGGVADDAFEIDLPKDVERLRG